MKPLKLILLTLSLLIISSTSSASESKFSVSHIQIGDTLEIVKEKKVGWSYNGLQTSKDENLIATFSQTISDVSMKDKWCVCIWLRAIGVHFNKQEKVDNINLVISSTIGDVKVVKNCSKTDTEKCVEYGNKVVGELLAELIDRYGMPIEEQKQSLTMFKWNDHDYTLSLLSSPIKSVLSLRKNE